jgi:hypothetical protein
VKFALLILAAVLLLGGCGGGPKVTQTRDVAPYTGLQVNGGVDVDIVPGSAPQVVVTGGKDVIDRVKTVTQDGVLTVAIEDRGIVIGPDPFDDVKVEVPVAGLSDVQVQGSGDFELGRIDLDTLNVEIQGSADLRANGSVGDLTVAIEGSGDAHLADLAARTARVTIEGSGDVQLNVSDELDVKVEGAGDVTYRGNPQLRQQVEGSGEVRPAD